MAPGKYSTPPLAPDDDSTSYTGRIGFGMIIGIVLFGLLTTWLGVYYVDTGYVGILKRNGAIIGVVDPGMHVKIPYLDSVVDIETRVRGSHLELSVSSSDPMMLPVKATVNWVPVQANIAKLYNDYGTLEQFEERVINPAFQSAIKDATSQFETAELIKSRSKMEAAAFAMVRSKVPSDYVTVSMLQVVDVSYPPQYTQQIPNTQVAQQAAAEQKFKLEQQKYVAQEKTQSAQADADATKARADGDAYATKINGQAVADAISLKAKALAQNPLLVDYEKVQRWGGSFPSTFMGGESGVNTMWQMPATTNSASTGGPAR